MEDATNITVEEDCFDVEEIGESFCCCVCLDLLYKPVVLSCGHASCFWCVFRAMNHVGESNCPICRCTYYHFPTICELLHYLLLKMYPLTYKRREKQTLECEKERGSFSPQFDDQSSEPIADRHTDCLMDDANSSTMTSDSSSCEGPSSKSKEPSGTMKKSESTYTIQGNESLGNKKATTCQQYLDESRKQISVNDVLCVACKQLLFRPVILNCGHVYCESCLVNPDVKVLKCDVCHSFHPEGFPKVCLELAHFLEKEFQKDYEFRRIAVDLKKFRSMSECQTPCSANLGKGGPSVSSAQSGQTSMLESADHESNIHVGVGCDFCGVYPIVGDRYKCMDCEEAIGFDLCGDCYTTRPKRPGRFNQKHTTEHKLELCNTLGAARFINEFSDYIRWVTSTVTFHEDPEIWASSEYLTSVSPNNDVQDEDDGNNDRQDEDEDQQHQSQA